MRIVCVYLYRTHARGGITLIADGRTTQKVLMQLGMGRELQYLVSFSTNDDKANDSFYSEACAMHPLFGCIQRATANNAYMHCSFDIMEAAMVPPPAMAVAPPYIIPEI